MNITAHSTDPAEIPRVDARSLLLPYALTVVAAMIVIQSLIAATGGQLGILAATLTAVVAIAIAVWLWRNFRALTKVRFGLVIAHTIAYVAVTTSFNLHAVIRAVTLAQTEDGYAKVARDLLETPWFGATLVMSSVWGIGLLIHLFGVVLGRGWED